jgi:hypothetical protein
VAQTIVFRRLRVFPEAEEFKPLKTTVCTTLSLVVLRALYRVPKR